MKGCIVRLLLLFAFLSIVLLALGIGASYIPRAPWVQAVQIAIDRIDQPVSNSDERITFSVGKGDSAGQIAERLESRGIIQNATLFKFLAMYYGVSSSLEAGDYELKSNMTTSDIIGKLHRGLVRIVTVMIPEGWRTEQTATELSSKGVFEFSKYVEATRAEDFSYAFLAGKPKGTTLEGYLFPDTYNILPTMTAKDFVELQLHTFDTRITEAMRNRAVARGLTLHQVLILASIVERETAVPQERPLIAGVYLNRFKKDMLLQADPTVQYALTKDPTSVQRFGYWKKGLLLSDLSIESPYNTYKYSALPPGPIANPGLDSIEAVIEPAQTEYYFFVAKPDGSHAFARTLEEHNQNVSRYQQ